MKKLLAALLAASLLLCGASAENPYFFDWVGAFNILADAKGLATFTTDAFEYESEDGYFAAMLDESTIFMLGFADGGEVSVCALQAQQGDERVAPLLACALAVTAENVSYETALELFEKLLIKLDGGGEMTYDVQDGWYLIAAAQSDLNGRYVVTAFSATGDFDSFSDDAMPGDIWEGLDPEGELPAPSATEAPQEGHYKI
ncbi:MAG: hypothetical protein IJM56_02590 [Clostridia bacterium]|nr:hypothetical protein [Clostridia bacterium]MBQ9408900.1 hypothetical protein [Clostridia bacterium]